MLSQGIYHGLVPIHVNCNALLSNFCSIICQVVAYGKLNMEENFKLLVLNVVVVTYDRLLRGSK